MFAQMYTDKKFAHSDWQAKTHVEYAPVYYYIFDYLSPETRMPDFLGRKSWNNYDSGVKTISFLSVCEVGIKKYVMVLCLKSISTCTSCPALSDSPLANGLQ